MKKGPMLVLAFGGYLTITGKLSLGALLAFFYFSGRLFSPVAEIIGQYLVIQRASVGVERLYEYLDRDSAINEPDRPVDIPGGPLSIEFTHVYFRYQSREQVLSDLSFSVSSGETVGIVGTSGAGKSTIANLIYRFWDVESGEVSISGINVKNVSLDSLRSRMAIVSQETALFHDSVRGNLLLANPDASQSDIEDACTVAGIHEFVTSLPERYDTVVGERGVKLSGGQRQRLSIARAILRNPDLVLFDEATSHLDSETEALVQHALNQLTKSRTSILIAHRLSTLTACDRIIVLENGNVIEEGSHSEHMQAGGTYHRLWKKQTTQ